MTSGGFGARWRDQKLLEQVVRAMLHDVDLAPLGIEPAQFFEGLHGEGTPEQRLWRTVMLDMIADYFDDRPIPREKGSSRRRTAEAWIAEMSYDLAGFGWVCDILGIDASAAAIALARARAALESVRLRAGGLSKTRRIVRTKLPTPTRMVAVAVGGLVAC